MFAKIVSLLGLGILLIAFQNCGQSGNSSASSIRATDSGGSQAVIGTTAAFKKIVYDPRLEITQSATSGHVELDLDNGAATLVLDTSTYDCTVDAVRLQAARDILATSEICKPAPLPAGEASCDAIGLADLELSNASASVELRPVVCNSGTFLCDGNDLKLRDLIADLKANLPVNCTVH